MNDFWLSCVYTISGLVIAAALYWYWIMNKWFWSNNIDGPKGVPIFGNLFQLVPSPGILKWFQDLSIKYNGVVGLSVCFTPGLSISNYKLVELMLKSSKLTQKTFNYIFLENWLGTGLLLSNGPKWHSRRKIITPAFHFKILDQFIEVFDTSSKVLLQQFQKEVDNGVTVTDLHQCLHACTLDAICETAMRTKVNTQTDKASKYLSAVKDVTHIVMVRLFSPWLHSDFLYQFSASYRAERKALKVLHDYTKSVIRTRRKELAALKSKESSTNNTDDLGRKSKFAFIDILLQSTNAEGQPLSDADILEEVQTFMFAGHDTTASGLCFALYSIARHPEVQAKIIEEQRTIFGDDRNRVIETQDVAQMKYLELVIKETLRMYPPVPSVGRKITEDTQFENIKLRKGLNTMVNIMLLHRDPEFFPDPDRFDPERFERDAANIAKHPFCYIPFSAGLRNCIGQKFSMLEMKVVLSHVLQKFQLSPGDDKHKPFLLQKITLTSENGFPVKLENRKW